jgi:hypothetical protein
VQHFFVPKSHQAAKDGNSDKHFSIMEIRSVTLATHNQKVANKREHSIFHEKEERAFNLYYAGARKKWLIIFPSFINKSL